MQHLGKRFGNYTLTRLLGTGGYGDVYLGVSEEGSRQPVAIKVLRTPLNENTSIKAALNFINETRHFRLRHPHIMPILDFGVQRPNNLPYLIMAYAPHGSLRQRHPPNTQLPLETVVYYVNQIADALQYAHEEMVVHRDIKPENLLVGASGEILLTDFSIAIVSHITMSSPTTQELLGTCDYAAPEQFQGAAGPASDQYSLAIVVYEWLCGSRPFAGTGAIELALKHLTAMPPPLSRYNPEIPVETERAVLKALSKEPQQRFQTIQDFAAALERSAQPQLWFLSGKRPAIIVPSQPVDTIPQTALAPALALISPSHPLSRLFAPVKLLPAKIWTSLVLIMLVLVLITSLTIGIPRLLPLLTTHSSPAYQRLSGNSIGVTNDSEHLGISDGTFALDTQRNDGQLKQLAMKKLQQGDSTSTISLLDQAVSQDSSDAEALIYLEDLRVTNSGLPYVTLVVGSMFSPDTLTAGRDDLQGAYVAQKEFNDAARSHNQIQVRLLIANAGGSSLNATRVAEQIVQLAHADKTVVGVMGWPYSAYASNAIRILQSAHIPMVSQTATGDTLTGISPYFFRVAPSNMAQGQTGAQYAEHVLQAKRVAIFLDPADPYSQSLAQDFSQQLQKDGGGIVATEQYTEGKPEQLPDLLLDALGHSPDALYFSGYAEDLGTLLAKLPPGNMPVLGGDGLYNLGGYPASAKAGFSRLHFTALAYPDEWDVLGHAAQKPKFFSEYSAAFNPTGVHHDTPYGYTRANDSVILSYDATMALLTGVNIALRLHPQQKTVTPEALRQALTEITGQNSVQGVSGCISFGPDGNPQNKSFVVLVVTQGGFIHMEPRSVGRFLC